MAVDQLSNGAAVRDVDGSGSITKSDSDIMELSILLGVPISEIVQFLSSYSGKKDAWLATATQRADSDPAFVSVMQTPEAREIFLGEMNGDFSKLDDYKAAASSVNDTYEALDKNNPSNYSSKSVSFFMTHFGSDPAKIQDFATKLAAIIAEHPALASLDLLQASVMLDPSALSALDKAMDDYEKAMDDYESRPDGLYDYESSAGISGSPSDFHMFFHQFNGDVAAFTEMLTSKAALIALDPALTSEMVDGWIASSLASGKTPAEVNASMQVVLSEHKAKKGEEGYSVAKALLGGDRTEVFTDAIDWAGEQMEVINDALENVNDIKKLSGELLNMYQKSKEDGSMSDTPEMRAKREELGVALLKYEGYSDEQIAALKGDGSQVPSQALIDACKAEGYQGMETNRFGNDDDHTAEEWQVNIEGITGIVNIFKDESMALLSHVQELMKYIEKMIQAASTLTESISDIAGLAAQ